MHGISSARDRWVFLIWVCTITVMPSQIIGNPTICSVICFSWYQRKHQASLYRPFVRGINRWPNNSPQKRASNAESVSMFWRRYDLSAKLFADSQVFMYSRRYVMFGRTKNCSIWWNKFLALLKSSEILCGIWELRHPRTRPPQYPGIKVSNWAARFYATQIVWCV